MFDVDTSGEFDVVVWVLDDTELKKALLRVQSGRVTAAEAYAVLIECSSEYVAEVPVR